MGQITLYRVTNPADTIGNVPATEKIVFNSSADRTAENAFCDNLRIIPSEAIGQNNSPGAEFSNQQPLGRFEKLYQIHGFISRVKGTFDDGQNVLVGILEKWESEEKINSDFPEGRFGIQVNDMRDYDVIPTNAGSGDATGLIIRTIEWDLTFDKKPQQVGIVIPLTQGRGDGT